MRDEYVEQETGAHVNNGLAGVIFEEYCYGNEHVK